MQEESQRRIEGAVREILKVFDVGETTEAYENTPRRVSRMYMELFSGLDKKNEPSIRLFDNTDYRDILTVKNIPFYSMCAHHLLPFFGHVSIAYIPGEKICGLSKFPRIVKYFASRPQVQEDFTKELADYLYEKLKARGVLVLITAKHLCMEMRGIKTHDVEAVSSAIRGNFEKNSSSKEEALKILLS
jgi:GTP cyclohydrolase I